VNPALYQPQQSGLAKALHVLGLPGVACSFALFLLWPLALAFLIRMPWWMGLALTVPWWILLVRYAALVRLLAGYFMVVFALLGWVLLGVGLHLAGVF
jgi:hypothetical protein